MSSTLKNAILDTVQEDQTDICAISSLTSITLSCTFANIKFIDQKCLVKPWNIASIIRVLTTNSIIVSINLRCSSDESLGSQQPISHELTIYYPWINHYSGWCLMIAIRSVQQIRWSTAPGSLQPWQVGCRGVKPWVVGRCEFHQWLEGENTIGYHYYCNW